MKSFIKCGALPASVDADVTHVRGNDGVAKLNAYERGEGR